MSTCKQEFLNKGCMCLANPLNPWKTVCGYINRENGLVFPCDEGCCIPSCDGPAFGPRFDQEVRRSTGTELPPGFGKDLAQSDEPTSGCSARTMKSGSKKGSCTSDFGGGAGWQTVVQPDRKVWELALSGCVLLVLIFFACFALETGA